MKFLEVSLLTSDSVLVKYKTSEKEAESVVEFYDSLNPEWLPFAVSMLCVGRLEIDVLRLPVVCGTLESVVEIINYYSQKSLKPHSIKVEPFFFFRRCKVKRFKEPVILTGGGIDSSMVTFFYVLERKERPLLLFFNYGQAAATFELESVKRVAEKLGLNVRVVKVNLQKLRKMLNLFPSISIEGPFPARNWFFYICTLGLGDFKEISVNVFKGEFDENHPDHSPKAMWFLQNLCKLLNYKSRVVVPIKDLDKGEVMFWLRNQTDIKEIRSCYSFFRRTCGACTGCLNKFVSFVGSGAEVTDFEDTRVKPFNSRKFFEKYLHRVFTDHYPESRKKEISFVVEKCLPFVRKNLYKKYIDSLGDEKLERLKSFASSHSKFLETLNLDKIKEKVNGAFTFNFA